MTMTRRLELPPELRKRAGDCLFCSHETMQYMRREDLYHRFGEKAACLVCPVCYFSTPVERDVGKAVSTYRLRKTQIHDTILDEYSKGYRYGKSNCDTLREGLRSFYQLLKQNMEEDNEES